MARSAVSFVRRVASGARRDDWSELNVDQLSALGLRVLENFVNAKEASEIESSLRQVLIDYGASHITSEQRKVYERQMVHLDLQDTPVNMIRATGRPEKEYQKQCPWGYGDNFKSDQLPSVIQKLGDAIQSRLHLGALRDVTVNQRKYGFFRLDPHLDPLDDGENVCIIGLCSDTVLTLTSLGPPLSTIIDQRLAALESWVPGEDIDILSQRNSLIHLRGSSRTTLNHAIRLGVSQSQLAALGIDLPLSSFAEQQQDLSPKLHDWFGSLFSPIPRSQERISVVFAFANRWQIYYYEPKHLLLKVDSGLKSSG